MSKYRKLTHVYYKCDYHIVFTPKYRFRILEGMVKSLVEHNLQLISSWKDGNQIHPLYCQIIGRGSRVLKDKKEFTVLDLGNNAARFGLWGTPLNWQKIFNSPLYYLENLICDEDIERQFSYTLPAEIRAEFPNTSDFFFDIKAHYDEAIRASMKSKIVLDKSLEQHCQWCVENSEDVFDARILSRLLQDDISDRIKKYSYCIIKSTKNYIQWLEEDYKRRLGTLINQRFS